MELPALGSSSDVWGEVSEMSVGRFTDEDLWRPWGGRNNSHPHSGRPGWDTPALMVPGQSEMDQTWFPPQRTPCCLMLKMLVSGPCIGNCYNLLVARKTLEEDIHVGCRSQK